MAKSKATQKIKPDNYLIFVDTCIFLDFYRARVKAGIDLLKHLSKVKDSLITTEQVRMEFKKNRQTVIIESHGGLSVPPQIQPPTFLYTARDSKQLTKDHKDWETRVRNLQKRLIRIMLQPTTDEVYKATQRILSHPSPYNLSPDNEANHSVTELARQRFQLGYPPRKNADTSYGDAINWEWIVQCSRDSGKHVIIVSRDADYGIVRKTEGYINDWLLEEFKGRTSRNQHIRLVPLLADALSQMGVNVKDTEVAEEEQIAAQPQAYDTEYFERLMRLENAVASDPANAPVNSLQERRAQLLIAERIMRNLGAKHYQVVFPEAFTGTAFGRPTVTQTPPKPAPSTRTAEGDKPDTNKDASETSQ